jgi:hypothetical protein
VRSAFLRKLSLSVLVGSVLALSAAASAAAYWDFQGNLPKPDGSRIYVKVNNVGPGRAGPVRMSWTYGSHCMRFLHINAGGGWDEVGMCGIDDMCIPWYDCTWSFYIASIYDKTGCENPPNLGTVWVNCRATSPLWG